MQSSKAVAQRWLSARKSTQSGHECVHIKEGVFEVCDHSQTWTCQLAAEKHILQTGASYNIGLIHAKFNLPEVLLAILTRLRVSVLIGYIYIPIQATY